MSKRVVVEGSCNSCDETWRGPQAISISVQEDDMDGAEERAREVFHSHTEMFGHEDVTVEDVVVEP